MNMNYEDAVRAPANGTGHETRETQISSGLARFASAHSKGHYTAPGGEDDNAPQQPHYYDGGNIVQGTYKGGQMCQAWGWLFFLRWSLTSSPHLQMCPMGCTCR